MLHPPRLATAILSVLAGRADDAFLLGDLAEEYREVAIDQGPRTASRWY